MSDENMDRIIERIQKILAKTKVGSGTTEEEAATAMRLVQDMLSKHNLDMAEVEAAHTSQNQPSTVERVQEEVEGKARYQWQRQLARYVAEAHFCYHLVVKRSKWTGERYTSYAANLFVGRQANVITAKLMYFYLVKAIEDMLPTDTGNGRQSNWAISWKEGAAHRLCERLSEKRQDLIKEHDDKMKAAREQRENEAMAQHRAKQKLLQEDRASGIKSRLENLAAGAFVADAPDLDEDPDQPDIDETDTWTPGDSDPEAAPTGTALVLASVYDKNEEEANREIAWGLEPGYFAKQRAAAAEQERLDAEAAAKAELDGVEKPLVEETERQRKARERRERDEADKRRRRWARESEARSRRADREWDRRNHSAYFTGQKAGDRIGIDTQVGGKPNQKQLKE